MSDLKPCPYCGGEVAYLRFIMQEADVFCPDCNANGPECDSEEEAIAAWNTRAPLTVQDAALVLAEAINSDMVTFNKALGTLTVHEDMPTQHFFAEAILAYATALRAAAEGRG